MLASHTVRAVPGFNWTPYLERYRRGEWRARIFRDMILADAAEKGGPLTFADIGCGHGFDGDFRLQKQLAEHAHAYLGIEPDPAIELQDCITHRYRNFFEDAPLAPSTVDLAFAVMVLEHLPNPQLFWDKVHEVLVDGGVFWGFTMDRRHWFCQASLWSERLHVKELYLRWLKGRRGQERYENYPVHYRSNTPADVARYTQRFRHCEVMSLGREDQLGFYLPKPLKPLFRCLDRQALARGKPGMVLAIRAVK